MEAVGLEAECFSDLVIFLKYFHELSDPCQRSRILYS